MQHDDSLIRLIVVVVPTFLLGIGWLVKHFMGRETAVVQLNLTEAQTEEIRARIRRDDDETTFGRLKVVAQELRADVERLRDERDDWRARTEAAEKQIELIRAERTIKRLEG